MRKIGPKDPFYHKHAHRDKLHKKHIQTFLDYVVQHHGYESLPTLGAYEVGRIKKEGEPPLIFYAREAPTQHVTVPYGATHLVSAFITWKRENGNEQHIHS